MFLGKSAFTVLGSPLLLVLPEYPVFYTKNYCISRISDFEKDFGNINVSTGDSSKQYMFDRDHDTYWESVGSDDTTTETIEVIFYEGTQTASRTFDTLLLANHNLRNFKLQYHDGVSYHDISDTIQEGYDLDFYYQEFSTISSCYKVKLVMDKTQTVNAEKKLGDFYLMKKLYSLSDGLDVYDPKNIEKGGSFRLSNGDRKKWQVAEKYTCTFGQDFVTQNEMDDYFDLYDNYPEFLWYPEPDLKPTKIYLVQWANLWADPYITKYKGAGYAIRVDLEEV